VIAVRIRCCFIELSPDISWQHQLYSAFSSRNYTLVNDADFRAFSDKIPHAAWSTDADGIPDFFNEAWRLFTGTRGSGTESLWALVHPDDRRAAEEYWHECIATLIDYEAQFRLKHHSGGYRWVIARGAPIRTQGGLICRWLGTCTDIDDLKKTEELLRERETELARVQRIGEVGGLEVDLSDGFRNKRSPEYLRIHGLQFIDRSETHASWVQRIHPEDRVVADMGFRASIKSEARHYEAEYRIVRPSDGEIRWISAKAEIERDEMGRAIRLVGAHIDITQRKLAEQARELLSRELSHRIKNIFSVVGALVTLTARHHPEAEGFAKEFLGRIKALDKAHDYVRPSPTLESSNRNDTVQDLTRKILEPYLSTAEPRIAIVGDDAPVGPLSATPLALIIHEQATNAVKYGALSNETGYVVIRGAIIADSYEMKWEEREGPAVAGPPQHRGFGTLMAARSIEMQLDGKIDHAWEGDGLIVNLTVPLEKLAN
jgi:PAS domain S-box-containing protein